MDKINAINGVILTPLKIIKNPLGDVYHGMKSSDIGFNGFGETYLSTVNYDIIKPWKKHLKMTLNLIVPVGKIRFVLFDDRINSDTKNQFMDVSLSKENYFRLTVPPGIWMSFRGEEKSLNLLLNIANIEHDPSETIRADINKFNFNWD